MSGRVLILSDANLASLLACASAAEEISALDDAAAEAARPIVLPYRLAEPLTQTHMDAVSRQTRHYLLSPCSADRHPASSTGPSGSEGEREAVNLLSACHLAAGLGCTRVIWPVSAAGGESIDIDRLSAVTDKSRVVSRLAMLDLPPPGVTIETPYAELTDKQIADLALDIDASIETCWWWSSRQGVKLGASERTRWTNALTAAGWAGAPA